MTITTAAVLRMLPRKMRMEKRIMMKMMSVYYKKTPLFLFSLVSEMKPYREGDDD
ncbi:hypothetical protein HanRHA438_Chr04g0202051 [Helianthus annuus]|nr:hypothetical protein HanIR_Chr11g0547931 [Helianthus annuus]KAJ0929174.1 hypothetical protein HanRHA438_Chr04g0202051 [Helianthus annuus]